MRLPFRTRIPQREHVLAAPFLAAEKPTSRRKNRVGGFARRTAYRAPRNTAQVAKPRRVAAGCSYKPASGRAYFLNQDPISEQGGLNLYGFCFNNAINKWDYLGMDPPDDWDDDYIRDGNARDSGGSPNLTNNGIVDFSGGWSFSDNYGSPDLAATGRDLNTIATINGRLAAGQNVTVQDASGNTYTLTPSDRTTFSDGGMDISIGGFAPTPTLMSVADMGAQINKDIASGALLAATGGERWLQGAQAAVGLVANTAGLVTAFGLAVLPEPTMLSKAGAVALGLKTSYGVGANFQNLVAAINGNQAPSTGALINDVTALALPGNQNAQNWASIADLTTDLSAGPLTRSAIQRSLGQFETFPAASRVFIRNPADLGVTVDLFQGLDAGTKLLPYVQPTPSTNSNPRRK